VIEASLTGHLVFSTMHTNSAAESTVRLLDFGLDPFNFADALIGVLGQRLVRRLCVGCSRPYPADDEELAKLAHEYCLGTELEPAQVVARWRARYGDAQGVLNLRRPCGCDLCDNSGYKGRLGVHELLVATPEVKKQISAKGGVAELVRTAVAQGMRTLRQDGIEKILQGQTCWEQVRAI
jgi:type II secretory ATPase GspE/PulE/Tfp pilus assembly ATPase PilB-like protein